VAGCILLYAAMQQTGHVCSRDAGMHAQLDSSAELPCLCGAHTSQRCRHVAARTTTGAQATPSIPAWNPGVNMSCTAANAIHGCGGLPLRGLPWLGHGLLQYHTAHHQQPSWPEWCLHACMGPHSKETNPFSVSVHTSFAQGATCCTFLCCAPGRSCPDQGRPTRPCRVTACAPHIWLISCLQVHAWLAGVLSSDNLRDRVSVGLGAASASMLVIAAAIGHL
jgi:hypothetical protein